MSGLTKRGKTIYAAVIRSRTGTIHDIEHLAATVATADHSTCENHGKKHARKRQ
jgi:hypothetical protein